MLFCAQMWRLLCFQSDFKASVCVWDYHDGFPARDFHAGKSKTCNFLACLKLLHIKITSFVSFFSIFSADVHVLLIHWAPPWWAQASRGRRGGGLYVQVLYINHLWKSASPPPHTTFTLCPPPSPPLSFHTQSPLFFFCRCGRVRDQHPQLSAQRALYEHSGLICMRAAGHLSCRLPAEKQCLWGWVHCSWCISLKPIYSAVIFRATKAVVGNSDDVFFSMQHGICFPSFRG